MSEKNLVIDKEKCINCGMCIEDCIAGALEFDENKVPRFAEGGEARCIECQHCLAVCPMGVVSVLNKNPDNSDKVQEHNPEQVLNLIKSRRSIRQYKSENVPAETIEKLKNMLNWSPTGCNFHKLHFAFVEDRAVMDKIRSYVNEKIVKILTSSPLSKIAGKFAHYKDALVKGEDVIFRGAPHMVVVSVPVNAPCANIDPVIALSYFELYAQSLGVGTCWCGFAEICMQLFPEIACAIHVPDGYKVSYVMLFGLPDVKYSRTTQPESFEYTAVRDFEPQKVNLIDKIKRYFWNTIR